MWWVESREEGFRTLKLGIWNKSQKVGRILEWINWKRQIRKNIIIWRWKQKASRFTKIDWWWKV